MSKQPPPAPTASAIGPCPTVIRIVGVRKFTGTDRNGLNYRNEPERTRFQLVFVIFTLNTQLFYSHTYFVCPPA